MNQRGITLIEILLVIAIFTIVTIVIANFIRQGYRTYTFSDEQNEAIIQARQGVITMIKELRETAPGDDGNYPLQLAADQELIFYSDIDRDEVVERIHYFLDGTNFKKGITKPTGDPLSYPANDDKVTVLSQYVRNGALPIFIYYNGDYPTDTENNPLATPADVTTVRLIHLHLIINIAPNRAPTNYELESNVQLRNLKDNL